MPDLLSLEAVAPFTTEAIVSRVLLKGAGGSATLFSFAEGEGLSEHTSTAHALAVVLAGEMEFTVDGTACSAGAGEAVKLPANVPHALHATSACRMLLFLLK